MLNNWNGLGIRAQREPAVRRWVGFCMAAFCGVTGLGQTVLPPNPISDDVFYSFMPIAWRDSNNDTYRYGDFGGMTASLDYLQQLGVTAVWMNPVFPSPAYHGYQHGPADQLNAWFGNSTDFRNFLLAAHAHGIKVFVDFVAYEISQNSTWFQSAYNNPASPYDTWLAFTNAANSTYSGGSYTTWNGARVPYILWNLNDPNPVSLDVAWARKWLDIDGDGDFSDGLDGYRCDHVYASAPEGWGANLPFWQTWNDSLRATNPNVFTFAEQGDWGSYGDNILPAFNGAFTKPFEFAVRDALAAESAVGIYPSMSTTLSKLANQPAGRTFLAIIGDHDVDRIMSVVGDNNAKAKMAAAILLLQPLPPIIYYGDEIGMRGIKGNYSGDAADIPRREPFKWNAVAGPPMSNYFAQNTSAYNGRYERNNDGRSVQEQTGVSGSMLETYRALIAARHSNPALSHGTYRPILATDTRPWVFVREVDWEQSVLVAINLSSSTINMTVDLHHLYLTGPTTPVDVFTHVSFPQLNLANVAAYPITLGPYETRAVQLNVWTNPPPICGDRNGDGQVDLIDLSQVLADYGCTSIGVPCAGDLNYDGVTDLVDLQTVLVQFGSSCP